MAHHLIGSYVEELDACLKGFWPARQRILMEISSHLEDSAEREQATGADPTTAQQVAVARLGPASVLAARFAEDRLAAALTPVLPVLAALVVAMVGCGWLDAAFPAPALFQWQEPQPLLDRLLRVGSVANVAGCVLVPLAFLLRNRPAFAAHAVSAVVTSLACAALGSGVGGLLQQLVEHGAASHGPVWARFAVTLAAFVVAAPVLLASDARSATVRDAR